VKQIGFLIPYPLKQAPSQRFRFEQYHSILTKSDFRYTSFPFLSGSDFQIINSRGRYALKLVILFKGFIKRLILIPLLNKFDFIFIHREATPAGPPIIEWVVAKILKKRIIYDFDDAIWLTDKTNESKIEKILRWRSKVASICKWSYKVSCGNEYLANYARQFNPNVVINPTTIDTENLHKPGVVPKENTNTITIGWTGSHSTLKYLKEIEVALQLLAKKYPHVQVLVIADRKPDLQIDNLVFLRWNKETEAEDLSKIDIGIMPLPDDEWSKGKCGFKALQYMAMEIPCVISPVGVNKQIIDHGVNGFLAESEQDWITHLEYLINNQSARIQLGLAGRQKVIEGYSVLSNTGNFLSLFE
jgi:glycosyltransferase involved in cell wall biosynthesis